ncbi:substrate-binding periplasmic protein [Alteromonas oceanisediminis]|uniref:substrate-binding periplasmic protein n=1 Tax=Alteromonas oceanisediminis TaxID=2836180 RepID=UPI001BD9A009|nr:transporter substrate-binding domain-containing protein [Alteromonas oceanisediminis]MBT0587501.1 transporter substrate-binding domain-containing protein [Alteromonas oceanisediminis]
MKWLPILLALSLPVASATDKLPELTWCVDHLPDRHAFIGNDVVGPTVDFMVTLSKEAQFTLLYEREATFADCLSSLAEGRHDLLVAINYSEERARFMDLIPLYDALPEQLFVKRSMRSVKTTQVNNITAATIGVPIGYVFNSNEFALLVTNNTMVEVDSIENGLAMLYYDHIDVLIAPALSTASIIQKNRRLQESLGVLPVKLTTSERRSVHLGMCKRCDISAPVRLRITQAIEKLKADNQILPIMYPEIQFNYLSQYD